MSKKDSIEVTKYVAIQARKQVVLVERPGDRQYVGVLDAMSHAALGGESVGLPYCRAVFSLRGEYCKGMSFVRFGYVFYREMLKVGDMLARGLW